jgi:hypothetical protein
VTPGGASGPRDQAVELATFWRDNGLHSYWTDSKTGDGAKVCTRKWDERAKPVNGNLGAAAGQIATRLKTRNPIIALRNSGLVGIDCDSEEDIAAFKTFGAPPTYSVRTSKGRHFYYRAPTDATVHALLFENGTIQAKANQYFVAPPAIHPSGHVYEGTDLPIVELPEDVLAAMVEAAGVRKDEERDRIAADPEAKVTEGSRHALLLSEAGRLANVGSLDEEGVFAALARINETRCDPPKTKTEVKRLAREAVAHWREKSNVDRLVDEPGKPKSGLVQFKPLSEFEEEAVRFFDRPLLQANSFHILAGRKGAGKGTYIANLCSRITRGELGPKKNILLVSSEDSPGMDLRPRVAVAGGVIEHVYVVSEGWLQLPRDVELIREQAKEIGDVAAVIIDPVGNHIGGKDSDAETAIRDAIGPLNGLADDLRAVVIGVRHLTEKEIRGGLLAAILGSSAWVQVPRVVIGIVEDDTDQSLRHIKVGAGNRVPPGEDALSFRITGVEREGHEVPITCLVWEGATDKDLDALLRGSGNAPKGTTRAAILNELETIYPHLVESTEFDERMAKRLKITPKTIRNARVALKNEGLVKAIPEKDEFGAVQRWMVTLAEMPEGS